MIHKGVLMMVLVFSLMLGAAAPAGAYVGPGAGLSLLGALWGLLLSIGAALGFVILWPLRRLLRRRRAKLAEQPESSSPSRD